MVATGEEGPTMGLGRSRTKLALPALPRSIAMPTVCDSTGLLFTPMVAAHSGPGRSRCTGSTTQAREAPWAKSI
jgi:hypothetical protein